MQLTSPSRSVGRTHVDGVRSALHCAEQDSPKINLRQFGSPLAKIDRPSLCMHRWAAGLAQPSMSPHLVRFSTLGLFRGPAEQTFRPVTLSCSK